MTSKSLTRKGSNLVQVRRYNERVVLEALHRLGQASKADIARSANLTPQAVATIVDALTEVGLVRLEGKRSGQLGQPSSLYAAAPEGAFAIGLHVGRRAFDAVLVDFTGKILQGETHEYDYPEPHAVADLAARVARTLKEALPAKLRPRVVGTGVTIPDFLGGWAKELELPGTIIQAWEDFDFQAQLQGEIAGPLFFENDASGAAAAELIYGKGRETRDFLYIFLSTLIGGGLVIDGNLETGPHGNSAAIAPHPVSPSRLSSAEPPKGPFETLLRRASVYVLMNHLRANGISIHRAYELTGLGDRAEPYVSEWIADCADALAQTIVGATAIVDVASVVIDGILPAPILECTIAAVSARFAAIMPEGLVAPKIEIGTIGSRAAAIGAAILPFHALFAPDSNVLVKARASSGFEQYGRLAAPL
jgi:predicted NBD/HSP70 family sugar kinase